MTNLDPNHLDALLRECPELEFSQSESDLQFYGQDASKHLHANASLVLFPKHTAQVQQIIQWANEFKLKLVPSGGRTGLSGGAVATQQEIVLSLGKMNRIFSFNAFDRSVRLQAGVITAELHRYARKQQLYYPVDFASSGSSHIGGNIATNAGGIRVLRYGLTRDWVSGLTIITGNGERLDLNHGLIKNATGYDLRHLIIGSEGTLGVITEATLQLTSEPPPQSVALFAVPHFADCLAILQCLRTHLQLSAFEFFSDPALNHVLAHSTLQAPFDLRAPYYVLAEYDAESHADQGSMERAFTHCLEQGWITDGILAHSQTQSQQLWQLRERVSESISSHTPYKNDISVCPSEAPKFLTELETLLLRAYPDYEIIWFGHIGDGNVHLNILKPDSLAHNQFLRQGQEISQLVGKTIAKFHGSISAEHGVGLLKKDYLHFSRSAIELNLMRQMKIVFDPNGVLNPGKLIDC